MKGTPLVNCHWQLNQFLFTHNFRIYLLLQFKMGYTSFKCVLWKFTGNKFCCHSSIIPRKLKLYYCLLCKHYRGEDMACRLLLIFMYYGHQQKIILNEDNLLSLQIEYYHQMHSFYLCFWTISYISLFLL